MTEHVESPHTIDAQIIEMKEPEKRLATAVQTVRAATPKTAPPQIPAPAQQPVQPVEKPAAPQTFPSAPTVSLPESHLPAGNKTSPVPAQSRAKSETGMPTQVKGEAISPPQFGAAYLNNPKPVYPSAARRMGMEGTVMLKVFVSRDGSAIKIEVAQSSGYEILDSAALQAVRNWRFIPARKGDIAVDEWVQVPVAFHLNR